MAELHIQLTRRADGGAVLRCVRADGSATWQPQDGPRAAFFPVHDLTHLAVEEGLGFRSGFFGLIADGWDIAETSGKGARGPLPAEAVMVEHLVGFLDVEQATGGAWSAAEYAAHLALRGVLPSAPVPAWLTDAALERVRARRRGLLAQWAAVASGSTLELTFERPAYAA